MLHNLPGVCGVKTQENPSHNTTAFLLSLMLASAMPAWEAQAEEFHQAQGRIEVHSLKEKISTSVLGNVVLHLLVNLLRKKGIKYTEKQIYIYMHISSLCLVISRSDVQHQWDHKNSYLYHIYDWPRTSRWMLLVSFRLAASSVCHHRLIQQTESFVLNQNTLPNISFLLLYSKCLLKMRNWPQFSLSGQHIFMVIVSSSSQISKEQYRAGHQQSTKKINHMYSLQV